MRRIDTSTKDVDLFGSGKHGFKNGNQSLGIQATQFNAEWCNGVQEEIAKVIEAAGIALNGSLYTQLLSALTAGWGMAKSIGTNGYQTLPGGLLMQWGSQSYTSVTGNFREVVHTFPIAFPTALLVACPVIYGTGSNDCVAVHDSSLTTLTVRMQDGSNNIVQDGDSKYLAIGY